MKYSEQLSGAVDKLDSAGKLFFNILLDESQKDPFKVIRRINDGVSNGEIESEYHIAASLARTAIKAALDPSAEKPDFNDRTAAVSLIREKIAEAEAVGDTEQAERFRAAMASTAAREELAETRAEEGLQKLEALKTANQVQKIEQYTEAFDDEKDATIMRLRNARMDRLEAEEYFSKHDEQRLSETLRRTHGVSAIEIAEHQESQKA